jgi:hypothetical protein
MIKKMNINNGGPKIEFLKTTKNALKSYAPNVSSVFASSLTSAGPNALLVGRKRNRKQQPGTRHCQPRTRKGVFVKQRQNERETIFGTGAR